MLLYPKSDIVKEKDYKIEKEEIKEMLHIRDVDLNYEGNLKEYISKIRDELKEKIMQFYSRNNN
jgi:hypothetical protein